MKIETETTITIKLDGQEFYLSREEALELYNGLKQTLGLNAGMDIDNYRDLEERFKRMRKRDIAPPMTPYPISSPIYPYVSPTTVPEEPSYPVVTCGCGNKHK